ncbi:MAG TPA: peptidoglycan DD-metalloendopeptidase family protein [Chthonomonadales bacterium]|nr:peptidoglycan DD-metalloendopeptidase family protein [Chthonomonadales bacterium]
MKLPGASLPAQPGSVRNLPAWRVGISFLPVIGCITVLLLSAAAAFPAQRRHHPGHHASRRHRASPHIRHKISAREVRLASARLRDLQRNRHNLRVRIHQIRAHIHRVKAQERAVTEDVNTVEARISRTRSHLHKVNNRLSYLADAHAATLVRLGKTQRRLAERRSLLAQRIRWNYERGDTTYAEVLLQSRSIHDLLSRGYYVRKIVRSDADLIQGVRKDLREVEVAQKQLEGQENEERALAADLESQKRQYASDLAEKQEILQGVRQERQQAEGELEGFSQEEEAEGPRILAYAAMLRQYEEQMREAARGSSGATQHFEPVPVWHGALIRPCGGRITSGFGYRFHPILHRMRMHTGVDIGAPYGTPIHAAAGGVVMHAGYEGGYGNCVIIDHGNGLSTLYGHCSVLLVSFGERVSQGQVIARVGATGMATGPHLHFEVRRNGVPVRPF